MKCVSECFYRFGLPFECECIVCVDETILRTDDER